MSAPPRQRVALLTPLPPEPTGVADHSAPLLSPLAERFELEVFTRDPERSAAALSGGPPPRRYADFAQGAPATAPGRIAVYQLGNHAGHHAEIYDLARRHAGVAVLHEYVLHDLVRDRALAEGGPRAWREELRYALGRSGDRLAASLDAGGEQPSPFAWPLFERVVDASLGVIVHSRAARDRVVRSRPLARVHVVPLALPPMPELSAGAAALRQELDIPAHATVLGAFGVAAGAKRLDVVVRAFGRLARARPDCLLLVAGPDSPRIVQEGGGIPSAVASRVRVLDRVSIDRLLAAMAATDVAINLRFPTGGETSSTCLRLLGLGCAVVVSDAGWFAEIPDDCCAKVPHDSLEEPMLDAILETLLARPDLRRDLGDNARRWARRHHSVAAAVDGYAAAVEETARAHASRAPARAPFAPGIAPPPPLAPFSRDDVDVEVLVEVAAALGDLGVTEGDEEILRTVARRVADLGVGG
jgi:glycosyltransferase involved in cell wall biosynthesis